MFIVPSGSSDFFANGMVSNVIVNILVRNNIYTMNLIKLMITTLVTNLKVSVRIIIDLFTA